MFIYNRSKLFALCFLISTIFFHAVYSQKRKTDLEKEKNENQQKIEETNRILEETRTKKTTTIGQLNVISQQIKEKNALIRTYEKEISLISYEINQAETSIFGLSRHLEALKKEYSVMIYNASKANATYSKLIFLFSSKTFNQLVMRLRYFKHYSQERQKQVNQIKIVAVSLRAKRQVLANKRSERTQLLADIKQENTSLTSLKGEQEFTITQLSQKETELLEELETRKKALRKIEKLITELIKKEMEKAALEAAANQSQKKIKSTPEVAILSSHFSGNKSKMIWPVQHGFISQKFGRRPHPVLSHVIVENLGVDIQTNKNEKVRSVFEGTVIAVDEVAGMNNILMIQHGEYYTFYAKLKSVYVKKGQKVQAKEFVGEVYTNEDEVSELQFQVWKNNEKQDPEVWLYNK
jgi:murein hydrolase activator